MDRENNASRFAELIDSEDSMHPYNLLRFVNLLRLFILIFFK